MHGSRFDALAKLAALSIGFGRMACNFECLDTQRTQDLPYCQSSGGCPRTDGFAVFLNGDRLIERCLDWPAREARPNINAEPGSSRFGETSGQAFEVLCHVRGQEV